MFTENKITELNNKIQNLADRPQMSAQALKAYFDGSAEELRIAHNALIDALSAFAPHTFSDVRYDAETGKLIFVLTDGAEKEIDLPMELLVKSGYYDADAQNIVLVLASGDTLNIPAGDLVDTYHADGITLVCKNNTFSVKGGVFATPETTAADIAKAKADATAEAKSYTDTRVNEKFTEAKSYTDALEEKTATDLSKAKADAVDTSKAYTDNVVEGAIADAWKEVSGGLPEITIEEADRLTDGIYRVVDEYHDIACPEGRRDNGILIASYYVCDTGNEETHSSLKQVWIRHDGSIVYRTNYSTDGSTYESDGCVWVDYDANAWEGWTAWKDVVQASFGKSRQLKLLKEITLEEDVTSLNVTFDKPLDEIAISFNVAFAKAENIALAARTDGGSWYMFYTGGSAKTSKQYFFAHAKEFAERFWECAASGSFFTNWQGIASSATTPKQVLSTRGGTLTRFVSGLNILIPGTTDNAFAVGSTIKIWGHEADE